MSQSKENGHNGLCLKVVTYPSTNPVSLGCSHFFLPLLFLGKTCSCVLSNFSVESVQSLLSCLVAVFCLVEVSLFCFDTSVVTLYTRASVTPPSPPSNFLLSMICLYPRFELQWNLPEQPPLVSDHLSLK